MQTAELPDRLQTWPQKQMKGISEDDLRASRKYRLRRHALDRAIRADRHERRRFDTAACECQAAAPRRIIGGEKLELHGSHLALLHYRCLRLAILPTSYLRAAGFVDRHPGEPPDPAPVLMQDTGSRCSPG